MYGAICLFCDPDMKAMFYFDTERERGLFASGHAQAYGHSYWHLS